MGGGGNNCHTRADTAALVISLKCLVQHTYRPLKVFSAIIRIYLEKYTVK